jgi:hypothetical protein
MSENDEQNKHYHELMNYLGLETIEEAKLFDLLETEYMQMGPWGAKVMTYLRSILSRNKRYTTYIQKEDQDLFKKIMKDSLDVLDLELKNYDKIQGINTQSEGGTGESPTV